MNGYRGGYSHGELIAKIGATTLTNLCGIPKSGGLPADPGMVEDWVRGVRANIGYLTLACAVAEVATGYVANGGRWEMRS